MPERADFEVCVIHKLLVARPHGPLSLFASLHGSLSHEMKKIDLLQGWEVDHVLGADHYPRHLPILTRVKPLVVLVLDGHGFVVWVEFSVGFTLLPRIWTRVVEPPVASEGKSFPL